MNRTRRGSGSGLGIIRAWSIAVGFAIGQVGAVVGTTVERRPAIVRDVVDETDGGFHPTERIPGGSVLTVPYRAGAVARPEAPRTGHLTHLN